jgi:DNA modification methylase
LEAFVSSSEQYWGGLRMAESKIINGDCLDKLKTLDAESVQCCVTSPPYWGLRDYGVEGQLGLEKTPEEYVAKMVDVFREVKRVLRNDGTLWLNLGDSYSGGGRGFGYGGKQDTNKGCDGMPKSIIADGLKSKDLVGIPWRVAFALQADGWYLRQDIIWAKPNPMPESVTDRCTKSHEYIFLLSKSARYFYDAEAVKEPNAPATVERAKYHWCKPDTKAAQYQDMNGLNRNETYPMNEAGRNRRSVWTITTKPYKEAHFATFPEEIPRTCILAGSKKGDTILDPFCGSGTTGEVALKLDRNFIGIELNQKYVNDLIIPRLDNVDPLFRVMEF